MSSIRGLSAFDPARVAYGSRGCREAGHPRIASSTGRDPGRVEEHYATASRSLHDGALGTGGVRFAQTTGYRISSFQDETQLSRP